MKAEYSRAKYGWKKCFWRPALTTPPFGNSPNQHTMQTFGGSSLTRLKGFVGRLTVHLVDLLQEYEPLNPSSTLQSHCDFTRMEYIEHNHHNNHWKRIKDVEEDLMAQQES